MVAGLTQKQPGGRNVDLAQNGCVKQRRVRTIKSLEWSPSGGRIPPTRKQTETTMINLKNMSDESGFFAVTAIAICVVLGVGVVGLLTPAAASPNGSTNNTTTYPGPTGYFPDQFVNRAKEVEPMPEMYY